MRVHEYEWANFFRVCVCSFISLLTSVWFYWACCYLIVGCVNTIVSLCWILKRWTDEKTCAIWMTSIEWERERERVREKEYARNVQNIFQNIFGHKIRGCIFCEQLKIIEALNSKCERFLCCKLHIFHVQVINL